MLTPSSKKCFQGKAENKEVGFFFHGLNVGGVNFNFMLRFRLRLDFLVRKSRKKSLPGFATKLLIYFQPVVNALQRFTDL